MDGTWTSVPLVTCTVVEAGAVLIAACLPLLRPLIKNLYAKHIKPLTRYLSKDGSFPRRSRSSKSEGLGIAGPKSYLNLGSVGRASIENHIYGEDGSRKGQSWRKIQNEVIPLDAIAVRHDITVSSNPP